MQKKMQKKMKKSWVHGIPHRRCLPSCRLRCSRARLWCASHSMYTWPMGDEGKWAGSQWRERGVKEVERERKKNGKNKQKRENSNQSVSMII